MRRVIGIALLAACSGLTSVTDGVVTLEVDTPASTTLEVGQTVRLTGRALDRDGTVVPGVIRWGTPDTTVGVDPTTGDVTGLVAQGGLGRVQALVDGEQGPLASGFITFTVSARADLLAVAGDSILTVGVGTTVSPILRAQLTSLQPAGPVSGREMTFRITEPAFPSEDARTVELNEGSLSLTVMTGADGTPATPVTVNLRPGQSPPDSVVVRVDAVQATGNPVPGSGIRFRIRFEQAP